MEQLHRQGKILYVGSSNFAGWQIATAQGVARSRNFFGLVSEQSVYNLAKRTVELEVLPACRHHGLGVIPYSPLSGGVLAGALAKAETGRRAGENAQKKVEELRPKLVAYEAFCKELGREPASVALAWLLSNPAVAAPIIGPRTLGQLESCTKALEFKLDETAMKKLDEIFPGPGGEAPKAYAW
jgi:aryl-alcohol dehydrogenase-like predicted oxidoreductase